MMRRNSGGFILVPVLIFFATIALWTLHGLAEGEINYSAAGHFLAAAQRGQALETRLANAERQLDLGETVTDPGVTVSDAGCVDLSGRWRPACAASQTHLYAYRILVRPAADAFPQAVEALFLTPSSPGRPLPPLPQRADSNRSTSFISTNEIFSDSSVLPLPGRVCFRQVTVW